MTRHMNAMLARRAIEAAVPLLEEIEGVCRGEPPFLADLATRAARAAAVAALCREALKAPPPGALTALQLEALTTAVELIDIIGRPPSLAELARELGQRSRSGAHALVAHLRDGGWIIPTAHHAKSAIWPTTAGLACARRRLAEIEAGGAAPALEVTDSGRAALGRAPERQPGGGVGEGSR